MGLCLRARWGTYSASPGTLAAFVRHNSRGMEGEGKEGGGKWMGGSPAALLIPPPGCRGARIVSG